MRGSAAAGDDFERFAEQGYCVRPALLAADLLAEARRLVRHGPPPKTCLWQKDLAASSASYHRLALNPVITDLLEPLLGSDVILWGASQVRREPGQVHCWHTDIESARREGGFVSVWIGIEGTTRASALKLVPGSHRFGVPVQRAVHDHGSTREATDDGDITRFARELDPECPGVVRPKVRDGDAIFFDGRLWHGSANPRGSAVRSALLLQYAVADAPVHIPDLEHLEWPNRLLSHPRPPCVQVSGRARDGVNDIVEAPPEVTADEAPLEPSRFQIDLGSKIEPGRIIRQRPLFGVRAAGAELVRAHYSILAPGQSPHPPHGHVDEEILIVLAGEATLRYADAEGAIREAVGTRGDVVYYPAFHRHTLGNEGTEPIVYLMFKWVGPRLDPEDPLGPQHFGIEAFERPVEDRAPFAPRELVCGSTHHLGRLQIHTSTLEPGAGYAPHADDHDVALLVFDGEVETVGQRVGPDGLLWLPAGSVHGMHNPGSSTARYLVVEFHGVGEGAEATRAGSASRRRPRERLLPLSPRRLFADVQRWLGAPRAG